MPKGIYQRTEKHIEHLLKLSRVSRSTRGGGYDAIHKWLRNNYGNANKCEHKRCESKIYHYALLKGKVHEHKRENYIMLCPKCHFDYDITHEIRVKQGLALKGKKLSEKHREAISKSMKGKNIGNTNAKKYGTK